MYVISGEKYVISIFSEFLASGTKSGTQRSKGLSPHICQCMGQFFVKRPKFLAATSNLRVEQTLVHLGRFCILAKKWLERP